MRMRKGFTLLEMLVVIVTLGVLSAVMMFSMLGTVTTADVNNIINNMQMLRTATQIWYKNNASRVVMIGSEYKIRTDGVDQTFSDFMKDHQDEIRKYLSNTDLLVLRPDKEGKNNTGDYSLIAVSKGKKWYVCYNSGTTGTIINDHGAESPELKVKEKLAGQAKTYKLSGSTDITKDKFQSVYTDQKWVCMSILELP
ncbi:MAG: type II secretion system protein [Synergistaceae bacterium]|nr:type II secretion system protein [Synergistaceae bacterium]